MADPASSLHLTLQYQGVELWGRKAAGSSRVFSQNKQGSRKTRAPGGHRQATAEEIAKHRRMAGASRGFPHVFS